MSFLTSLWGGAVSLFTALLNWKTTKRQTQQYTDAREDQLKLEKLENERKKKMALMEQALRRGDIDAVHRYRAECIGLSGQISGICARQRTNQTGK